MNNNKIPNDDSKIYFVSIKGSLLFFGFSIPISLLIYIFSFFPLGLRFNSENPEAGFNDMLFGFLALISGIISIILIKKYQKKELYLSQVFHIRFIYVWIALCLYVIGFQPLN